MEGGVRGAARLEDPGGVPARERYLTCLAELSTELLRTPDPLGFLSSAVRRLREATGAGRCYVLENRVGEDGAVFGTLRAESCARGLAPLLGRPELTDAPMSSLGVPAVAQGEPFHGPPEAIPGAARSPLGCEGLHWLAFLPIRVGRYWWGTLGLVTYRAGLRFEDPDVALLRTAANAIGAALERARREDDLRAREERFRRIADQAFDMVAELDAEGRYLYVSPSHEAVYGVPAASLLGRIAFEWIHPEDLAEAMEAFRAALPAGTGHASFRIRHRDGSLRWIEAVGRADRTADGPRAVIIGRDVTERRRTDVQRRRLEQAMDQAGDAIVVWDRQGEIQYVNAAWERTLGMTRAEALGRRIVDMATDMVGAEQLAEMNAALGGASTWQGRVRGSRGRVFDMNIAAVRDETGAIQHYISAARDVTREVELETRVRQQQKLEAIGTLATGIAHDFNNLLTGVLGYAELLEKDDVEEHALREAIGVIGQAARRGAELTSQLLRFSPRGRRASGPVDMHDVVREVVNLTARAFPRSIELQTDLRAPRCTVAGDAGQLQQVLLNLVLNARDAMPAGGTLRVETALAPGTEPPQLALRVRDTGCGIEESLRERIFEPFFTTKPREKGTGMGLAVVYGIVQSHGGSIHVESAPGAGAVFEVRLPLTNAVAPPAPPLEEPPATGAGRVLIVDDEPSVRRVAARMLQRLGYATEECADGAAALLRLRAGGEPFEAVLLDLDMPGLDGRACLRGLRELEPTLPVVLSTGLPTGELDVELVAGVTGVLPKPYDLATMARTIAAAVTKRAG